MRRGEHARRRARRRHPGAGHDQRLRRTVRQREPVLDHPGPGAQARISAACPTASCRRSRRCRTTWPRSPTSLQTSTWPMSASRVRAQGRHPRRRHAPYGAELPAHRSELVGNEMRVVVSELSGRGNLLSKAAEYGIEVEQGEKLGEVLETRSRRSRRRASPSKPPKPRSR